MEHILMQIKKRRGVTIPKLLMMILGFKNWWELAPQHFCTPLPCRKTHAKAFFDRNTQKKMSFFMSRRDALYTFEEIAPEYLSGIDPRDQTGV